MEKKTGFGILIMLTILVLGMYIGVGVSTSDWAPTGWLLSAMIALATLWAGYWLGRRDGKHK